MGLIACGEFQKKYIYFFLFYSCSMVILVLILYYIYGDLTNKENYNNILLNLFVANFGSIFFFIPELIINKYLFEKKENNLIKTSTFSIFRKEKTKLAIEYIFNNSSNKVTFKDILLILFCSILILIIDSIKIYIQIKNDEQKDQLILNGQFNFVELFFILILGYLMYKMRFYKHQIFSITIVIILGIFRYILRIYHYYGNHSVSTKVGQFFLLSGAALFESFVVIYAKGLMEYKFFSPYKIVYVFGIIDSIIVIALLTIFTFIKHENSNWFFKLKYEEFYYLDNIKSIIEVYKYKLFGLLFASIIYGNLKFIFNKVIHDYTVCHIFLLIQNKEIASNIFKEMTSKKGTIFVSLILTSHLIEFFAILVFLELIELKFWGLDENIKRNIKNRADIETRKSIEERNQNLYPRYESIESLSEDNNINSCSNV